MKDREELNIWVPGEPVPQGSMRSPKAGLVLHSNPKLKSWRAEIGWAAKDCWRGSALLDGPVSLDCAFVFTRTKRPRHPFWRDTAPDLDKLIRAVGDALEGVVLSNDARIVRVSAHKKWASPSSPPGASIGVWKL